MVERAGSLHRAERELPRERPFIERNLEATATAYGLAGADLEPFTVENNLMTPTMKPRRRAIETQYAPLIEEMYADSKRE